MIGTELPEMEARFISPQDAAMLVQAGHTVFIGSACATPKTVLSALENRESLPPDIILYHFLTTGIYGEGALTKTRLHHRVFFVGKDMRDFVRKGSADYIPIRLSEVPRLLENGRIKLDMAIIQVSEPDKNGYVSLGLSVDITLSAVRKAKVVVAEINPQMPRSNGDSFLHISELDHLVKVDHPPPEFTHELTNDIAKRIARYIAGIIEDGSTLQVGLGNIPNEALKHLGDRHNLGIHSDVITSGIVDLIRSGAVNGNAKTMQRGKIVASYCIGTAELYRMIDANPLFQFLPIEQVCDPAVISGHHKMVSITQAFGIDLTGQTAVDQFDGMFYGGVSTQPDFMRGASRAVNGKPIVCMTSTTDDGERSRIRPFLTRRDGVGIPRSDVHYVVTEYGIAYLFGKSIQERALSLIEIAHPAFRDELLKDAKELGYVTARQRSVRAGLYDIELERNVQLRDGSAVLIRPARASDARALQKLFHQLPQHDVYTRFFRSLKSLSLEDAQMLCNVDHDADVAFVAVTGAREDEVMVGSGCYFVNQASNLAETAFIVHPDWQGVGLGGALQAQLRELAIARGLRGFTAEILSGNEKMLRLARAAASEVSMDWEDECYHVVMLFDDQRSAGMSGDG